MQTENGYQVFDTIPGIRITIPPQQEARPLEVVRKTMPGRALMRPTYNFHPGRMLANFMIVDAEKPDEPVTDFDPPLLFEVTYDINDIFRAAVVDRRMKLAYYDDKKWFILNEVAEKFEILPPNSDGHGMCRIELTYWPADPPINWGT